MPRKNIVDTIKVSKQMFLFQPCVGSNKYPGIIEAAKYGFERLGVETVMSDDQACCGGFLTFTNVAQPTSTMPAVARNLALIEEMGLDAITLCNGCYTFLNEFSHFMNDRPPVKEVVNTILSMIGRKYEGNRSIYHAFEIFYKLKDTIKKRVAFPLKGLKIATHYGCHYLNGFKKTAIDDAFMPTGLEEIIEALGGEPVDYSENRSCCGTGLTQVILNKEKLSLPHSKMKFDSMKKAEPDAVVVICPYCLAQLDRMQQKLNYRKIDSYRTPVIHITQLVALACGVDIQKLGFGAHAISFKNFLKKFEETKKSSEVAHV